MTILTRKGRFTPASERGPELIRIPVLISWELNLPQGPFPIVGQDGAGVHRHTILVPRRRMPVYKPGDPDLAVWAWVP